MSLASGTLAPEAFRSAAVAPHPGGPGAGPPGAGPPEAGPPDGPPETGPRASLRERKKLATRRSLRRTALDLVAEHGFVHVTVEDIAEAADVSPRTFFNYFPSKEAALFGASPDRAGRLRQRLLAQPAGVSILDVLRVVLVDEARAMSEEIIALGGDPARWLGRMKLAHADPHLRAARAAHLAAAEVAVAAALAERLGADPERDPYPLLLASAAVGAMRAAISFWVSQGGTVPLDQLTEAACRSLAEGLPENCALRGITGTAAAARPPAVTVPPLREESA